MRKPELGAGVEATLIKEVKDAFDYDLKAWQDIRDEGDTDMKYVGGDPWDSTDREARKQAGRPCLTFDELGQYLNQPINEVRANPRAMKFSPTGNGANDRTAEFYANFAREIEYRSNAQIAYTTAFADGLQRSFGWVRVDMRFIPGSFKKQLWIEAIPNPNSVLPDGNSVKPDSSDMKRCFVFNMIPVADFKQKYPHAEVQSFGPDIIRDSGGWVSNNETVREAEFWKVEEVSKTLCLYQKGPQTVEKYEDDANWDKRGWVKKADREDQVPNVLQYITNGVEILKKTQWKGKSIPLASCYGKVLWQNESGTPVRKILSMTRLMRDPYMALCWARSNEMEALGTITKNPYWGYEGQVSPAQLQEVAKSLHEPVAMLLAKPFLEGMNGVGAPLPLPVRNPMSVDIQGYSIAAEEMRRAIQSAAGSNFLPTNAQKRNEKSGVALEKIDEQAQKGTYHFTDSFNMMIRRVGEIIEEVVEPTIDVSPEATVVTPDGTSKTVKIVQPGQDEGEKDAYSISGNHAVTVDVGRKFDDTRAEQNEFANGLLNKLDVIASVAGPQAAGKVFAKTIKMLNQGPLMDEIADIISPEEEEGEQMPPQAQAKLQQATQVIEQAKQEIDEMKQVIETKQVERQTELEKAQMDGQVRIEIARIQAGNRSETTAMQAEAKVHDTNTQADVDLKILRMESAIKAQELMLKKQELALKALTLQHQSEEAEKGRQHESMEGERGHERNLETADVGHQHAIEQQEHKPEAKA